MSAICPACGVFVKDLGRHKSRFRCKMQHIRAGMRGMKG